MARLLRSQSVVSTVRKPAVISDAVTHRPLDVTLAPSKRGKPKSKLSPPAVIGAAVVVTPLAPPPRITLAQRSGTERRRANPVLQGPEVVDDAVTFPGPTVKLAPSSRGKPKSKLRPPTILGAAVVPFLAAAPRVTLVAVRSAVERIRRLPHSALRAPAVVAAVVVAPLAPPVRIALAQRVAMERRRTRSALRAPTVVAPGVTFPGPKVALSPSKRGVPKSRLSPPTVTGGVAVAFGARPLQVKLAPSSRGKPKPRLAPPAVTGAAAAPFVASPVRVTLAQRPDQLRRAAHSKLRAPSVVGVFLPRPVAIALATSRTRTAQARRAARSRLRAPVVVAAASIFRAIQIRLAPSKRGKPKSWLPPPNLSGIRHILAPIHSGRISGTEAGGIDGREQGYVTDTVAGALDEDEDGLEHGHLALGMSGTLEESEGEEV